MVNHRLTVHLDPFIERELREYQLADRILVPSESARPWFIRRSTGAGRVVTVPYGVDIQPSPVPTEERRPDAVVSVATMGLRKGRPHLIQAFRMLDTRNASLALVGAVTPRWDKRLHLHQAGARATDSVSRIRVIEELQRASVFVLASINDGFGLAIAQAMACGLPVITTEATGVRALIADGVEGTVVPTSPDAQILVRHRGQVMAASHDRRSRPA